MDAVKDMEEEMGLLSYIYSCVMSNVEVNNGVLMDRRTQIKNVEERHNKVAGEKRCE